MKSIWIFAIITLFTIMVTANIITIIIDINMLEDKVKTLEHKQALTDKWFNSVHNPYNQPFVLEVSTELDIHPDSITQEQFYERYLKHE